MPKVLLQVPAKVTTEAEEAYNAWYNDEHVPKVLEISGALSARRYKRITGEGEYDYLTTYEFPDEETFKRFEKSAGIQELFADYDEAWEGASVRIRAAYLQIRSIRRTELSRREASGTARRCTRRP